MTERVVVDKIEFYITNVCNLTCSDCNRFNNYKFSGHWTWAEAEPVLTRWAEKIEIIKPVILGGEPLLNPDIVQWINGIRKLWPRYQAVQVQSNGTRIDLVKGLYESLTDGNWIGISIHDLNHKETIFARIRNFLKHPIIETEDPKHPSGSRWQFIDKNHTRVFVWNNDRFVTSSIIQLPNGKFTVHNSNPEEAHTNCTYHKAKLYHMIRGKIYKCGPVALMPEFDDQFGFDISDADRNLMKSYRGLSVENFDLWGRDFFDQIDRVIPQCKFCPPAYDIHPVTFTNLKPNKI